MIHGKLTLLDRMPHGPYEGRLVKEVLAVDPEELTAYTPNGCVPLYDIAPSVLSEAYKNTQEQLGWKEFMALWSRSE